MTAGLVVVAGLVGALQLVADRRNVEGSVEVVTRPDVTEVAERPGAPFAVWPATDLAGNLEYARQNRAGGGAFRNDPRGVAEVFARSVFDWSEPTVEAGGSGSSVSVRDARTGAVATIEMGVVDDGFPIVRFFHLEWGDPGDALSVQLYVEGTTASVHAPAVPGTTAELQIRYGSNLVVTSPTSDGAADWHVELGPDPGLPGSVIVLFRDASGAAVKGIGTPVPAGPVAAS